MARRLFTIGAAASLALCCAALAFFGWSVFSGDASVVFHLRGNLWEIACRGGVVLVDNQPQRDFEINSIAAANRSSKKRWEDEHDALRFAMEGAPYGPQYTAARLKMDAWEHVHGIKWHGPPEAPASAATEHHLHLLWIVLLLLVAPAAWVMTRGPEEEKRVRRGLSIAGQVALLACLILLLGIGVQSFRRPVAVYVFGPESVDVLLISRGKLRLGRPPVTNPQKLEAATQLASHFRNVDLLWTVSPPDPPRNLRPGIPLPRGPMISCEIRPDADYVSLEQASSPEAICACLRALQDPNRYQMAHIVLTRIARRSFAGGLPAGVSLGITRWYGSKVNNLQVQLTPEQAATAQEITFILQVLPEQQQKLQLQWHQLQDRFTREYPLWPLVAVLAIVPIRWILLALRQRSRRKRGECLTCGYSLRANASGVCPECGTPVPLALQAMAAKDPGCIGQE